MLKRIFGRKRRSNTASIAKERLQIVVAHERNRNKEANPDFMKDLQRDILEVVQRYLPVQANQIKIDMDREGEVDVLELNIVLSDTDDERAKAASISSEHE